MSSRPRRPAPFRAGHLKDNPAELLGRVLVSQERLAASELARVSQAWRLWSSCIARTAGEAKGADMAYATTLGEAAGVHRNAATRLLRRFDELGVFGWKAAPRGSRGLSELTLPPLDGPARFTGGHAPSKVHEGAATRTVDGALPCIELLSDEPMSSTSSLDTGTHRSSPSLIGPQDNEAERVAAGKPSKEELPRLARDELVRLAHREPELVTAIRAEMERREEFERRFAPFHGDERTGDTTGDDEAAQLRWQGANPSKVRARRRRETGGEHL
jgi:hypothetical protein